MEKPQTMMPVELTLTGLNCAACVGRAERALAAVPGVEEARVNLVTHKASLRLNRAAALADARAALDKAGYPAEPPQQTVLEVGEMTCASCVGRVERVLTALPGVESAVVNLATGTATVRHDGIGAQELADAVSAKGYPARIKAADAPKTDRQAAETEALRRAFLTSAVLTLPVFVMEMGGHVFPAFHHWLHGIADMRSLWLIQFVLTALVLAGPGRIFFRHGVPALLRGAPEMNSLVALGASAAFGYSTVATLAPGLLPEGARHVYFEAAAVIVTLILLGRWLEARARGQAGQAIRRLIDLAPQTARLIRGGEVIEVPVADLRPGHLLRLLPGERVAVDGEITEGRGHIDESMLTGEPVPAAKAPGDRVTGGTVNGASALTYRVTATGADTVLARIIALVEEAQASRLPVQALVDRVTRVFVPVVMALSALTFILWMIFAPSPALSQALVAAISVLIIACPCAMGLATPVSILVGTGRGAELGVLFRRGDALERLALARIVAFDKTGTLTEGRPALTDLTGDADALRLAAGAEAQSEHPLAQAIVAAAQERGLTIPPAHEVHADPGRGLSAQVEGHALRIGNLAALESAGLTPDPTLVERAAELATQAATPVHVAVDGAHVAVLGLSDPVRPESADTVAALHDLGLQVAMISGDVQATAQAIGKRLGIDRVVAGVLPEGKVEALREMGEGTVFVGDGINDAPALAAADTGIAIGTGTDVAIESAQVVLMQGDPAGVPRAIRLSRAVMRNIRQNLFWAFAYNVLLIPVAMGALVPFGGPGLSPMLAAGAMALSSVFVVTNALRLRRAG